MAKNAVWQDDYWLPLMQVYLQKPVGVKPVYSRPVVDLSLELHVAPHRLHARMKQLAQLSTPRLERIWHSYGNAPQRLARAVRLWREMRGFGDAAAFYDGVEVQETFERDFLPLPEDERLTPVALVLMLDLYFRLTPLTMVEQTPEVADMARMLRVSPALVVEVLDLYQLCDPYLNRSEVSMSSLLLPCQQVWQRFQGQEPQQLEQLAGELRAYYK